MKVLPLLLVLLLGCATTRGTAGGAMDEGQRDKGFGPSRTTRQALEDSFAPRRIAVVVGAGTYRDPAFPPLRWAENDAIEVGRILGDPSYGGFDRVISLVGVGAARRDRVLAEMVSLRNDLRRQDTLVVFISGHGTMALDGAGEARLYLVAEDTRPGDLPGTAIELAELQRFFSDIRAERKALILDACYNGEAKSRLPPTIQQRIERMDGVPVLSRTVRLGENEAHLFASTFGRPAREDDSLQHGVYTYHLLEALTWNQKEADRSGDGVVTTYEAHDYARSRTVTYTQGVQIPEAYFRVVGRNDLVLTGKPEARRVADAGLVYFYGGRGEALDGATLLVDGRAKGVFPGTFPIDGGVHRLTVTDGDGAVLQDRILTIRPGESLLASTLAEQPRTWMGFLGLGPEIRLGLGDGLRPLLGRAWLGVQAWGGLRVPGKLPGFTLHLGAGYTPQVARFVDGDLTTYRARHAGWVGLGVGARAVLPRGSLGLAWRGRLHGISALDGPGCNGVAACQGWLWFAQGVVVEQQLALGRRWSLRFAEDVEFSALDADGQGTRPAVSVGLTVGIEVGL